MEALFFSFSKRKNSTKVPVDSTGTTFNITLKEPTSMDTPALVLSADTFSFNYCKFNNQYFFVSQIVSRRNNLWEVQLEKDVLATFRSQILGTSAYVLYDNQGNSEIVDSRLAVKTTPSIQSNAAAFPSLDKNIGRYILSCVGTNSANSWLIPYRMNPSSVVNSVFIQNVYDSIDSVVPTWSDDSTDPTTAIQKLSDLVDKIYFFGTNFLKRAWSNQLSSGNAMDCIRGCTWLPFDWQSSGNAEIITLGKYNTGFAATKLGTPSDPAIRTLSTVTLTIPWQFSDWRNTAPYTQLYLYIPFIGVISLPPSSLKGATSIDITPSLNVISGDLAIRVSCGSQTIGTYGANVAVPVPLGSSNIAPGKMLNSLLTGVTGAAINATSGNVITAGAAALNGIAGATLAAISGQPSSVGGLSSGAAVGLLTNIVIFSVCHDTVVTPSSVSAAVGMPAFAVKQIGTLSGYVQCHEFSLNAAAESGDLDAVNNYLNSGVFIE